MPVQEKRNINLNTGDGDSGEKNVTADHPGCLCIMSLNRMTQTIKSTEHISTVQYGRLKTFYCNRKI